MFYVFIKDNKIVNIASEYGTTQRVDVASVLRTESADRVEFFDSVEKLTKRLLAQRKVEEAGGFPPRDVLYQQLKAVSNRLKKGLPASSKEALEILSVCSEYIAKAETCINENADTIFDSVKNNCKKFVADLKDLRDRLKEEKEDE